MGWKITSNSNHRSATNSTLYLTHNSALLTHTASLLGHCLNRTTSTPVPGVLNVPTAEGLEPYSFMACTDQLYCVLCWRLVRGWEVEVMSEVMNEVEMLVKVTV